MNTVDIDFLRAAIKAAQRARDNGDQPFGAVLVDSDGQLLLEAENSICTEGDCTAHAETNIARMASQKFDSKFLETCTLYASTEPCAMCAGAIYWSGVGRVVFALGSERFGRLRGDDPPASSIDLSCREVFARCRRVVEVEGPTIEDEAEIVHHGFWGAE
jgi:tRNA(Arg) A34 adenosine deaminase TadA